MPTTLTTMSLLSNTAALRQLLFPPACFICQQAVVGDESICQKCSQTIAPLVQPRLCPRCALPLPDGALSGICGHCLASPPSHLRAVSLFAYRDAVREAILHWKLGGDDRAIGWLLEVASTTICQTIQPQDLLIPIPMPLQRMRQTGQHHAANLCRCIAEATGCSWEWRWLRRNGNQPRQSSLTRKQRRANLRHAFQLDTRYQPATTSERTIWIIDDIMTTGATLHFAAHTMARQKIPSAAFTLARTLRND